MNQPKHLSNSLHPTHWLKTAEAATLQILTLQLHSAYHTALLYVH